MIYEPRYEMPYAVVEALRLAKRTEEKYPAALLRDEAQDALVQLARYVGELQDALANIGREDRLLSPSTLRKLAREALNA